MISFFFLLYFNYGVSHYILPIFVETSIICKLLIMNMSIVMNKINMYFNSAFYSKNDDSNKTLIDHLVIETLISMSRANYSKS